MTPTIGPQFGPQFPAILDKEIQPEPIIPFYFSDIGEVHFGKMARVTGLEPATSGVTGRHSNQLSYTRAFPISDDRKARLNKPAVPVK